MKAYKKSDLRLETFQANYQHQLESFLFQFFFFVGEGSFFFFNLHICYYKFSFSFAGNAFLIAVAQYATVFRIIFKGSLYRAYGFSRMQTVTSIVGSAYEPISNYGEESTQIMTSLLLLAAYDLLQNRKYPTVGTLTQKYVPVVTYQVCNSMS